MENKLYDAVTLLESTAVDKAEALFYAAKNADEAAMDLLIAKGTNKHVALALAAQKGNNAAMDLLISKSADINNALALATRNDKEDAVALLKEKNAVDNNEEAALSSSLIGEKDSSLEEEQEVSSSQGGNDPDSNAVQALLSLGKRSRVEDEEESVIHSSKKQKTCEGSAASSANSVGKDAGGKQNSLETDGEEGNLNEVSNVVELKIRIDGHKIVLSKTEQDLVDAEQALTDIIEYGDNLSEETVLSAEKSNVEFDSECASENESQESSMLSQFGEFAYGLIKDALSAPVVVFTDKASMGVFASSSPDYGLPKLDMGGNSFENTYEVF